MRAAARVRAAAGAARRRRVREHPRHVVLFSLAAGLALGPVSPAATVVAALAGAALAGRPGVALLAAGAALGGATLADARLAALDSGPLAAMTGERWEGTAVVLEPVRRRGAHASARVRLRGLDDVAVVRLRGGASPGVGDVVAVAGFVAPLGKYDAFQRRRGAHAALEADRLRADRGRPGRCGRRARRRAPAGRGRARPRAARGGGGAAARHGARPGRGAHGAGGDRLPALRARPPARRLGPERDAARAARARRGHGRPGPGCGRGSSPRSR